MRNVKGKNLKVGMVLALPFGKTATISEAKAGTRFMNFRTQHGKSRIELETEILVEDEKPAKKRTPRTCGHSGFVEDGRCEKGHGSK